MSTLRIEKKLTKLKERHDTLLAELLEAPPMLRGSFICVATRCGKATCWCAKSDQGHLHNRMTWSEHGKMMTRKVPEDEVERVEELTGNYRQFKKRKRELCTVQKQLLEAITKLEATANDQTRRPLNYLALTPNIVTLSKKPGRKSTRRKKARSW